MQLSSNVQINQDLNTFCEGLILTDTDVKIFSFIPAAIQMFFRGSVCMLFKFSVLSLEVGKLLLFFLMHRDPDVDDSASMQGHNRFMFTAMFIFLVMSRRCITITTASSGSGKTCIQGPVAVTVSVSCLSVLPPLSRWPVLTKHWHQSEFIRTRTALTLTWWFALEIMGTALNTCAPCRRSRSATTNTRRTQSGHQGYTDRNDQHIRFSLSGYQKHTCTHRSKTLQ